MHFKVYRALFYMLSHLILMEKGGAKLQLSEKFVWYITFQGEADKLGITTIFSPNIIID